MEHDAVIPAGEGRLYTARGSRMLFKALAESDDGDFSLMERTLPAGGRRPPVHRHTDCSEAYFVLAGSVSVELDGQELTLEPEDFVLVPRGAAHSFGNVSDASARLLVIHAPAKDRYFSALHDLWGREVPPTRDEELALMARHGMTPA
jgi:mannose-6-phosphate isomerase-like protein (cupin superfamily)